MIDRDGTESAGGMVFRDGSMAGIGAGTLEVRAPWHDFVRPVNWGRGMVAMSLDTWTGMGRPSAQDPGLVELCGEVWAAGRSVVYQPKALVVRVADVAAGGRVGPSWKPLLGERPQRPEALGDGAWRYLIANETPIDGRSGGGSR
ncbi:MAG: hypothetical protein R2695_13600 [Acidimicrobiales bacterium]